MHGACIVVLLVMSNLILNIPMLVFCLNSIFNSCCVVVFNHINFNLVHNEIYVFITLILCVSLCSYIVC